MSSEEDHGPAPDNRPSKRSKRRFWVIAGLLLLIGTGLLVGILVWHQRSERPPIEGEIDDTLLSAPTRLCVDGQRSDCRRPEAVRKLLAQPGLTIAQVEATTGGVQGAVSLAVEDSEGTRVRVKWRSQSDAGIVNGPARELAAYHVQALLLEQDDYVIPPVAGHCFDIDRYREMVDATAEPLDDSRCVFGFLTYWLQDATRLFEARESGLLPTPEEGTYDPDPQLFLPERFAEGGAYRRALAVANLITHLINNGDAHAGQFVLYTEPFHVFLIDSSIAFDSIANPRMMLLQNLAEMTVPAIPADVAERLRAIERSDLDALRVIEEHDRGDDGLYRPTAPGPGLDDDERFRVEDERVQLGLSDEAIEGVWERIEGVREMLESGELATF